MDECQPPGPFLPAPVVNLTVPVDNKTFTEWRLRPWANSTSFAIKASIGGQEIFSYENIAIGYNVSGVRTGDIQFRVASTTKAFTVLAVLLSKYQIGWDDPITNFVPGLRDNVWKSVTIGMLASQVSGLGKNRYVADLYYQLGNNAGPLLGLPTVSNTSPNCDYVLGVRVCSQEEVLTMFHSPEWLPESPGTGPAYSNVGFNLLGMALASVHSKSYEDVISDLITEPLDMTRTTFKTPKAGEAVLPRANDSWWVGDFANYNPTGGLWSTANDLLKFQQAILEHKQLSASEVRQSLKPHALTSSLYQAVGVIPGYGAYAVLVPEYDPAISITLAGARSGATVNDLMSLAVEAIVPFADAAARTQANAKYTGTFSAANSSSMTIAQDEGPGLAITKWTNDGVDVTESEEKWRLSFEVVESEKGFADGGCGSWLSADSFRYVQGRADELTFGIKGAKAGSVVVGAWRNELVREGR
ncbi:beta-lactamase/transpeptidase-like protein [Polyplosphaeria fusca]|uniref:Beta-lactamase/transpeptidase-like protein n=1 Tax=Polyplosphaeria fusca TaxID=682080 RepID=A0A9P4QV99_9PLEO|nr:beta-lactamase/transpeptidase-like protein [Polyplosphaeria fusca]